MAVYMLETTLTQEILARFFERICIAEVKKLVGHWPDFEEGFQSGYVYCFVDLFGQADDQKNQLTYDKGESYLHVVDEIISDEAVADLIQAIRGRGDEVNLDDLKNIDMVVPVAVRNYMKQNPNAASTAVGAI